MFSVYAVSRVKGGRHRHFLASVETMDEAKHIASCATGGNADYAYVQDSAGRAVFFLRPPTYDPQPIDPKRSRPPMF